MSFGDWLRERREELGSTQEELASKLGVHPVTCHHWEHGETLPRDPAVVPGLAIELDADAKEIARMLVRERDGDTSGFAFELRVARLAAGLSCEEAARVVGCSRSEMQRWETGQTPPGRTSRRRVEENLLHRDPYEVRAEAKDPATIRGGCDGCEWRDYCERVTRSGSKVPVACEKVDDQDRIWAEMVGQTKLLEQRRRRTKTKADSWE